MASLTFTRRFSQSPFQQALERHLQKLQKHLSPTTIALENAFSGPATLDNGCPRPRPRSGVFVDPTTIVTSAHLVGRVNPAGGSGVYESNLGATFAITPNRRALKTEPLAVSFAHDVAVLKLAAPPDEEIVTSFRHCSIAKTPPEKDDILVAIHHMEYAQFTIPGNVRATGERTFKVKPPWPLDDDDSGWMEFDFQTNGRCGGNIRQSRYLFSNNGDQEITGSLTCFSGSPLFNIEGELIGVCSWEVREKGPPFLVIFAANLLRIEAAVDYAKSKKPDDPIVMDSWISN